MNITASMIRIMQKNLGLSEQHVNGKLDQRTEDALDEALIQRSNDLDPRHADNILSSESRKRKATAFAQLAAVEREIDTGVVDGFLGPQTDFAILNLVFLSKHGQLPHRWVGHQQHIPNPNNWPEERPETLNDFYGPPNEEGTELVTISVPYPHKLSWDPSTRVNRIKCHRKVAASIERVLSKVVDAYGRQDISRLGLDLWGGCFNFRLKRGGTTPSMHSWGIAMDYDPDRNRLSWGFSRATFASPDFDPWWKCWEDEGWVSLGRTQNRDWMHLQAARLPE